MIIDILFTIAGFYFGFFIAALMNAAKDEE